ncbi:uncharacterized protein LOC119335605 isoform X2 [Triticum dicoccoides]|uniref:uncharacterized protein LOC119335605 isoform X2 n=1 Tax=Triticum dicoccoides TaxID=85692 RepID=UPI0018913DED|nr:uncharacterized protein LOC119335605 isoform X2 [Triticum dicoccoides]
MLSVVFDGGCDIRRLPRKKGCIGKWGLNNLLCHLNFNLIIDEARYSRFIESYFFHQIDMVVCTNYGISFFEQLLTVFPSFNFSAIASTNLRVEKVLVEGFHAPPPSPPPSPGREGSSDEAEVDVDTW